MTYAELQQLFREMGKHRYISQCNYAQQIMSTHSISLSTIQRWRVAGIDNTLDKAFGYCATCSAFFKRNQSKQVICGSITCDKAHKKFMSKQNGYNKGRVKKQSVRGDMKRKAQRRVSSQRATSTHKPWTEKEIETVRKSKLKRFDLAIELGRSVCAIEGLITRINKENQ